MYGRRRSVILQTLLRMLSWVYAVIVQVRTWCYQAGALRRRRLPVPVLSVGNLTLGGTGKTPTVIQIAALLQQFGKRPAVVSRGYGRRDESTVQTVSDGTSILTSIGEGGDEPVLIAQRLAGVPVVVGSDRYQAGAYALSRFNSDVIVLDDGFQHMGLRRDLDIVLLNGADPFGKDLLFPAGILREPLSSLRRAQLVLITHADAVRDLTALTSRIRRYCAAPIFTSRYAPRDIVHVATGESRPLAALRGTATLAFSGIARPASFVSLLAGIGADIRSERHYPDHHAFTKADLAGLYQQAVDTGAVMIITTEKDAVRLQEMNPEGIWALRVELEVQERGSWESAVREHL